MLAFIYLHQIATLRHQGRTRRIEFWNLEFTNMYRLSYTGGGYKSYIQSLYLKS